MRRLSVIWMILGMLLPVFAGCDKTETVSEPEYLIRVGRSMMTASEFGRAFEVYKTSYDYDALKDADALRTARLRFVNQLIERLTLTERARELRLAISDAELGAAVKEIQSGYPDGEFEKTLLESAISYGAWRDELRTRLLMEKVVRKDLTDTLPVSVQETEAFREALKANKKKTGKKRAKKDGKAAEAPDSAAIEAHLRREKTEASYPAWLEKLRKRYAVDIDRKRLEEILDA